MMSIYPPKEKKCHMTGFQKSCAALNKSGACSDRWARFTGTNQDGKEEDFYGCVDDYAHRLDLDRGRRLTALQKAVETRADMVAAHVDRVANVMQQISAQMETHHRQSMTLIQDQHNEAVAISTGCRPLSLDVEKLRLLAAPEPEKDDMN